jgi:hypothetical protein
MLKNQKGFTAFEGVLIALLLIAIGGVGYFAYQARHTAQDNSVNVTHKSATPAPKQASLPQTGKITGNVSYPSEGLPGDEQVCAVATTGGNPICAKVGGKSSTAYELSVPVGKYYVYSTAEEEMSGYKAYYNQYSKCGNSADCPSSGHAQYIEGDVKAGSTVSGADPGDWYNT